MKFVFIGPGQFMMGSPQDEEGRDDDETLHEVRITKGYWISSTEVTRSQYAAFVIDTGYITFAESHGNGWAPWHASSRGGEYPVDWLTWNDANAFCDWLTQKEARTYRLPAEAQWESACRAGTTTRFHTGDACPSTQQANVQQFAADPGSRGPRTFTDVGSYPPNAWGLYDMHGNAAEWCRDWYAPYSEEPAINPGGPSSGEFKVMRGGKYSHSADVARSAARSRRGTDEPTGGFRVVLELAGQ